MKGRRMKYPTALKRQVVEELLSENSSMGELSKRYEVSKSIIFYWREQYIEGKLEENISSNVTVLKDRVKNLERMVGRLSMDKELLKKALEFSMKRKEESSLPITAKNLEESDGGAK